MPFDGLIKTRLEDRSQPLHDALARLGIDPVPLDELLAHKANEVAKHPPSFFWRHQAVLPVVNIVTSLSTLLFGGLAVRALASGMALIDPLETFSLLIGLFASFVAMCRSSLVLVKPPAQWEEQPFHVHLPATMPAPIRELARDVARSAPGARFIIGTLMQRSVMLDPYLLVMVPGDHQVACLGIWDHDEIIRVARRAA